MHNRRSLRLCPRPQLPRPSFQSPIYAHSGAAGRYTGPRQSSGRNIVQKAPTQSPNGTAPGGIRLGSHGPQQQQHSPLPPLSPPSHAFELPLSARSSTGPLATGGVRAGPVIASPAARRAGTAAEESPAAACECRERGPTGAGGTRDAVPPRCATGAACTRRVRFCR